MLTHIVVVPAGMRFDHHQQQQQRWRQGLGIASTRERCGSNLSGQASVSGGSSAPTDTVATTGKTKASNARLASKGISALVCIKSTLACIPVLASILKNYLDSHRIERDAKSNSDGKTTPREQQKDTAESEVNQAALRDEATIATAKSSLLVGLGVGNGHRKSGSASACTSSALSSSIIIRDQLLSAIVFALSQSDLEVIREVIDGAFTQSTAFTKNANAMKHQECFALKSSDDNGMMDILRKVGFFSSPFGSYSSTPLFASHSLADDYYCY